MVKYISEVVVDVKVLSDSLTLVVVTVTSDVTVVVDAGRAVVVVSITV